MRRPASPLQEREELSLLGSQRVLLRDQEMVQDEVVEMPWM